MRATIYCSLGMALAVLALTPATSRAQTSASADATVSVDVLAALSLTKNADLDMGVVNPGAGAVSVAATAANAGKFTAAGQESTSITVTFPSSVTLTNGTDNLTVTPGVNSKATDDQATSTAVTSGSTVTLSGVGNQYFWLGGDTNVGAVSTGTYSGTFTLSVAY